MPETHVMEREVAEDRALETADGELALPPGVQRDDDLIAEPATEAVGADDDQRGAGENDEEREDGDADPLRDAQRPSQKNAPIEKWTAKKGSPGGGSSGNPTSRRSGPTGVS